MIKDSDHNIALEFLNKLKIKKSSYILKSVSHDKINSYLNAADIGFSIRDNHILNYTTPSGKILEYLAAGLTVITTCYMGEISEKLKKKDFGIILEDKKSNDELIKKFNLNYTRLKKNRKKISEWANDEFSINSRISSYVSVLKKI